MRILIIEDDIKTAAYLESGLSAGGYTVSIAHNGQEGLFLATEHAFDLVILDVMLPKLDGFSVLRALRGIHPDLRIILLTARDDVNDKVKGLELGADDYLIKPFAFSELRARIKAIFRRATHRQADKIVIADLEIDLAKHSVKRAAQKIELTAQEFKLLLFLAEHTGEVVSRTLIAEAVWDIHFNTDTNAVDVAVKRLRHKIDAGFDKKLIHTLRGLGYVFEAH